MPTDYGSWRPLCSLFMARRTERPAARARSFSAAITLASSATPRAALATVARARGSWTTRRTAKRTKRLNNADMVATSLRSVAPILAVRRSAPGVCRFGARLGQKAFALRLLARCLARPANGFALLAGSFLGRLLVSPPALHFPEQALALELLLQRPEGLVDIVVSDENLQGNSPSDGGARPSSRLRAVPAYSHSAAAPSVIDNGLAREPATRRPCDALDPFMWRLSRPGSMAEPSRCAHSRPPSR